MTLCGPRRACSLRMTRFNLFLGRGKVRRHPGIRKSVLIRGIGRLSLGECVIPDSLNHEPLDDDVVQIEPCAEDRLGSSIHQRQEHGPRRGPVELGGCAKKRSVLLMDRFTKERS